jgi:hypothetical protein
MFHCQTVGTFSYCNCCQLLWKIKFHSIPLSNCTGYCHSNTMRDAFLGPFTFPPPPLPPPASASASPPASPSVSPPTSLSASLVMSVWFVSLVSEDLLWCRLVRFEPLEIVSILAVWNAGHSTYPSSFPFELLFAVYIVNMLFSLSMW